MTGAIDEIARDNLTESFGGPSPDQVTDKTTMNIKVLNSVV